LEQKSKKKRLWKRVWEEADIIFIILSLVQAFNLVNTVVDFFKGTTTSLKVGLDSAVFLSVIGAFIIFFRRIHRLTSQLETIPLPVCFVAGKTVEKARQGFDELQSAVSDFTGFSEWNKIEGLSSHAYYLMPYERDNLPPDTSKWKKYLTDAVQSIRSTAYSLPGKKVYHVAVNGPASLAIGMGAVFGTKYPMVLYHYENDCYTPVLDLRRSARCVKEHLPVEHQFRYFKVMYPKSYTEDVAIVINAASDNATIKVQQYLNNQKTGMSLVLVDNLYDGNLKEKDWLMPVRELFTVFYNLSKAEVVSRIHLFHAMQVIMGFGLGMALGQFKDITIYNYEKTPPPTYYPVLKLNDLGITY
jgi:hypothetical protein